MHNYYWLDHFGGPFAFKITFPEQISLPSKSDYHHQAIREMISIEYIHFDKENDLRYRVVAVKCKKILHFEM